MTLSKFNDKVSITAYSSMIVLKVVAAAPPGTLAYTAAATAAAPPTILYVSTGTALIKVLDTKVGIPKSISSPIAIVGVTATVAPEILVISAGYESIPSHEQVSLLAYESLPSRENVKNTFWTMYDYCPSQEETRNIFESSRDSIMSIFQSMRLQ